MTDIAFAKAMMAVYAATKGAFRIVEVPAQILKANNTGKISERFLAFGRSTQIIPGSESMAGINADADAGFIFHAVDNRRERCSNLNPEVTALTGGVFNHRGDTLSFIQRNVDGFGNTRKAILF